MSRLCIRLLLSVFVFPIVVFQFYGHLAAQQESTANAKPELDNGNTNKKAEHSKEEDTKTAFTRIREDASGNPVAFETAIIRYTGKNEKGREFTVDLVGAVHIGEQSYYEKLNEEFEQYESLLYELVAPKGTVIEKGKKRDSSMSVVSSFQRGMKDMLGLDFQLDHVDYTKKNFIHADMSPEEFSKSMKANDESMMKMFFRIMGHSMAAKGSKGTISDADLLAAFFSDDRELTMRRLLAQQLQNGDAMLSVFEGKDGSTIITHRNRKALEVLKEQLGEGKTNLGIFYGAGHFPEMEEALIEDFNVTKTGEKWVVAWSLEDSNPKGKKKSKRRKK